MRRWAAIAIAGLWLAAPAGLCAQVEDDAQALYESGVRALERADPEAARVLFEGAVEREARAEFVLALAATLQELGQPTAAVRWYTRLLDGEFGSLGSPRAEAIARARESASTEQSVLSVRVRGADAVEIEVDGERVGSVGPGARLSVRVDAGHHALRSVSGGASSDAVELSVGRGEQRALTLDAPRGPLAADSSPSDVQAGDPAAPAAASGSGPDVAPWVMVGLSVAPLAVGVATAALFQEQLDLASAAADHRSARPHTLEAEPLGVVATVAFSLAGAVALVGLVWGLVELGRAPAEAQP